MPQGMIWLVLVLCVFAPWRALFCQPPEPVWNTDYPKALAEARRTGKPLFVVITCRH
jgi:hypothetical protein